MVLQSDLAVSFLITLIFLFAIVYYIEKKLLKSMPVSASTNQYMQQNALLTQLLNQRVQYMMSGVYQQEEVNQPVVHMNGFWFSRPVGVSEDEHKEKLAMVINAYPEKFGLPVGTIIEHKKS